MNSECEPKLLDCSTLNIGNRDEPLSTIIIIVYQHHKTSESPLVPYRNRFYPNKHKHVRRAMRTLQGFNHLDDSSSLQYGVSTHTGPK